MKSIHLWGVRQNNLKNIEVHIPLEKLTVICGPSGSGKSSLAFDTLFAEGQRRFIESMSNYARQFLNKAPKPDIDGIENIPPAISIEQKNSVRSSRSIVGTATEITDYLRLLYEKLGKCFCPTHNCQTEKHSPNSAVDKILGELDGLRGYVYVEVNEDNRVAQGKKLHALMLQEGFIRIINLSNNEITDISEPKNIKRGLPKTTFHILIDRMGFTKDERGRLLDSISQAYEACQKFNTKILGRKCFVKTTDGKTLKFTENQTCPKCDYVAPEMSSRFFSFNTPIGACPTCKGFGNLMELDPAKIIPNDTLNLNQGAIHPFAMPSAQSDRKYLIKFCQNHKINMDRPWKLLSQKHKDLVWNGDDDFWGVKGLFEYLETKKYKMHVRVFLSRFKSPFQCKTCKGSRLRQEAHHVYFRDKTFIELSQMTIEELNEFFGKLRVSQIEKELSAEILRQIRARLEFLMRVGLNYITLNRETRTLSGGEFQRINLATQLGMGLTQTLYVLDEPTIGLHPRDNDRLISILKDLRNLGNTLVVVEHDHDVIKNSDYIIEMGPKSGYLGGEIVYSGPTKDFYNFPKSNTAPYLKDKKSIHWSTRTVDQSKYKYMLEIKGARGHNLKNLNVKIPLNRFVVITGVSGSGKSTLITQTLYPALAKLLDVENTPSQEYEELIGVDLIKNVSLIDQTPIGKTSRSNPVTYLKAFDSIRNVMASTPDAKVRGYTPGTFSLNVDGGRCPLCKGVGYEEIDMVFMDNVIVACEACNGKKYRDEILEITHKKLNIYEILKLTVDQAMDFFRDEPSIRRSLLILKEVGLDYLQLGQSASSLSGGESQRLKIAKELSQITQKSTLYILDEPTTGLHFQEIDLLIKVIHKLIEAGGSVVMVEHNLDVIASADYVIDLGPEAGHRGGELVACGSPKEIMLNPRSLTGQYLKRYVGG